MNQVRFFKLFVLTLLLLGAGLACNRGEKAIPREPNAYRMYLKETIPEVLRATTCQCCNKSLMECFDETLNTEIRGCPDT